VDGDETNGVKTVGDKDEKKHERYLNELYWNVYGIVGADTRFLEDE
jgi:hypothetical protein